MSYFRAGHGAMIAVIIVICKDKKLAGLGIGDLSLLVHLIGHKLAVSLPWPVLSNRGLALQSPTIYQ